MCEHCGYDPKTSVIISQPTFFIAEDGGLGMHIDESALPSVETLRARMAEHAANRKEGELSIEDLYAIQTMAWALQFAIVSDSGMKEITSLALLHVLQQRLDLAPLALLDLAGGGRPEEREEAPSFSFQQMLNDLAVENMKKDKAN